MTTLTFDTYKVIKDLEASGLRAEQAEAISNAVRESHEMADLATKSDLRELELRIVIKLGTIVVGAITLASLILGFLMKVH